MHATIEKSSTMKNRCKEMGAIFALCMGLAFSEAHAASNASLDKSAMSALDQCKQVSSSCAAETKKAAGILVFPDVVKADLIIGGAGGKGVLIENGKVTGYYNIGAASAGLQAGIESASQVYVFRNAESLNKLKQGSEWKVGAQGDVAVIEADANARATNGNVLAYVFDAKGLHAGVSLDVFDAWKTGSSRPTQS